MIELKEKKQELENRLRLEEQSVSATNTVTAHVSSSQLLQGTSQLSPAPRSPKTKKPRLKQSRLSKSSNQNINASALFDAVDDDDVVLPIKKKQKLETSKSESLAIEGIINAIKQVEVKTDILGELMEMMQVKKMSRITDGISQLSISTVPSTQSSQLLNNSSLLRDEPDFRIINEGDVYIEFGPEFEIGYEDLPSNNHNWKNKSDTKLNVSSEKCSQLTKINIPTFGAHMIKEHKSKEISNKSQYELYYNELRTVKYDSIVRNQSTPIKYLFDELESILTWWKNSGEQTAQLRHILDLVFLISNFIKKHPQTVIEIVAVHFNVMISLARILELCFECENDQCFIQTNILNFFIVIFRYTSSL